MSHVSEISTPEIPAAVPDSSHYARRYTKGGRIFSFAHQIETALAFEPRSVLEVGVGTGIVAAALRAAGLDVTTLDIRPDLQPDLTGSVTSIPAENMAFDVSVCCQVLEHLPFDDFLPALIELRRVSRLGAVISLPDTSAYYWFSCRFPKCRTFTWAISRTRRVSQEHKKRAFDDAGHYWEIGYEQYPLSRITESMTDAGFQLEATWRVTELKYHRFFKLISR